MSRLHARVGTIRQLEILCALKDHGSVMAAAKALHLTQPTVSMQLRKLSEAVGMPLYFQVGRQIQLTDAGLAVVASAREILSCFERLDMNLTKMRGLTAGTLRIAVVTTAKYFIPHLIGDFCQLYPDINVELKVGNREQISARMAEGIDDFCVFSHPPKKAEYLLTEFLPNNLMAIAPHGHALSKAGRIPLQEFARAPVLMREQGSGTRYAIERHMEKHNCDLNVRMTIESNEAVKHMVMSGMGVSILSEHALSVGDSSGLVVLDVEDMPIKTNWFLVRSRSRPISPVAEALLDYVKQEDRLAQLTTMLPGE
ncbi:LysR family transcriptional regulator [Microbulbifer agarilyticus]|uniref:LysR family transcriptional regulator n=1 Tax=Microbulbifer agarilyticus TaxID=260552 RepID=A0A1Q2M1F3_9GAMM|nr:LysR family transcriptional regulator [Microbulbifer agarilyticus]AQQ66358.1 LysR family transcriptional regulator [Microbulbifer agarilyticus]